MILILYSNILQGLFGWHQTGDVAERRAPRYTYDTYVLDILRQSHDMYNTFLASSNAVKKCSKIPLRTPHCCFIFWWKALALPTQSQ